MTKPRILRFPWNAELAPARQLAARAPPAEFFPALRQLARRGGAGAGGCWPSGNRSSPTWGPERDSSGRGRNSPMSPAPPPEMQKRELAPRPVATRPHLRNSHAASMSKIARNVTIQSRIARPPKEISHPLATRKWDHSGHPSSAIVRGIKYDPTLAQCSLDLTQRLQRQLKTRRYPLALEALLHELLQHIYARAHTIALIFGLRPNTMRSVDVRGPGSNRTR